MIFHSFYEVNIILFIRNSFEGYAWVRLIYGGGSWSVWTAVNATKRKYTGKLNSSPVTSTAPVVRVQQNCERVIDIRGKSRFFLSLLTDTGEIIFSFCD